MYIYIYIHDPPLFVVSPPQWYGLDLAGGPGQAKPRKTKENQGKAKKSKEKQGKARKCLGFRV